MTGRVTPIWRTPRVRTAIPDPMNVLHTYQAALERRWSPNTVKLRIGYVARAFKEINLDTATTDDLIDYINRHADWKPRTVRVVLDGLRGYYRFCIEQGLRADNPATSIRAPKIPPGFERIADDETILAALTVASPMDRAIILLGAECGLRAAEIAALHRDCRRGEWLRVTGKGGATRMLFMSPELCDTLTLLEQTRMRDGFYFPGMKPGTHTSVSTIWHHVRDLMHINTHSLRHRAATAAYRNSGHDLRLTQAFLGHSSPSTTAIYIHVQQYDLIRAAHATRLAA